MSPQAHPSREPEPYPLALIDLPPVAYELHAKVRGLTYRVLRGLECTSETRHVVCGDDLFEAASNAYVIVESGVIKLSLLGRPIRLYSAGDLIHPNAAPGARAEALFACDLRTLPRPRMEALLEMSPARREIWRELCELDGQLLQLLCASYAPEDVQPHVSIRRYESGEIVTRQGEAPGEIFELIQGEATVTIDHVEIGRIREGEIFGEMSFLTGRDRVATVTAKTPCLIQAIARDDFARAVRARPELMISLGRTLAERVTELDRRIVSGA